jgi:hypothetical protein
MCSRRVVTGLLCASVVLALVALGTEASAGCTKPPCAGVKWFGGSCICCGTGSEIFDFTASGVPGWLVKGCPDGKNCLKCSVFGTADVGLGCNPLTLDPLCGIEGVLFCNNHGGNASKAEGQPFTIAAAMSGQATSPTATSKASARGVSRFSETCRPTSARIPIGRPWRSPPRDSTDSAAPATSGTTRTVSARRAAPRHARSKDSDAPSARSRSRGTRSRISVACSPRSTL